MFNVLDTSGRCSSILTIIAMKISYYNILRVNKSIFVKTQIIPYAYKIRIEMVLGIKMKNFTVMNRTEVSRFFPFLL